MLMNKFPAASLPAFQFLEKEVRPPFENWFDLVFSAIMRLDIPLVKGRDGGHIRAYKNGRGGFVGIFTISKWHKSLLREGYIDCSLGLAHYFVWNRLSEAEWMAIWVFARFFFLSSD